MTEISKSMILLFLLTFSLLTAKLDFCIATERTVGVHVDDYFKYEIKLIEFQTNDPLVISNSSSVITPPTQNRSFVEIYIEQIQDTNVTCQVVSKFENGTESGNGTVSVDVRTGAGVRLILASNLGVNDTTYEISEDDYGIWRINETVPRSYLGGMRETNHVTTTLQDSFWMDNSSYQITDFIDQYWDKETGVQVEANPIMQIQRKNYTTILSLQTLIIDSNRWIIPEFSSFPILPLFMMATLLVFVVYRRKYSFYVKG